MRIGNNRLTWGNDGSLYVGRTKLSWPGDNGIQRVVWDGKVEFDIQGVTAIALLAESHISIHTWPEKGMAVCDVFTCGEHTSPRSAATYMYEATGANDIKSEIIKRSDD